MIIALTEYARLHNRSGDTLRRLAESGALKTAKKIGRNWTVDSEEAYPSKKTDNSKAHHGCFSILRLRRYGFRSYRRF